MAAPVRPATAMVKDSLFKHHLSLLPHRVPGRLRIQRRPTRNQ